MSRCFPFPPPGYKKLRVEDVTLLAKEKGKEIKEKKHKKDKDKDKDKKEGKEKDRKKSKDRHKEKDKDKEKRAHKDRDKKNEKKRSRDEKKFEGGSNVEKVGSNSPQSSCVQELKQRISFVDASTRNQSVHTECDEGKAAFSRRNGVYSEAKIELDQRENGQHDNIASKLPKIVFSNGVEQRPAQIGQTLENDINKSTEGKHVQKCHIISKNREKSEIRNAKRLKGEAEIVPRESAIVWDLKQRIKDDNGAVGSQIEAKANAIIQKRPENDVAAFSHMKESSEFGDVSRRLENGHGQKGSNHSKVPKVSIIHNNQSKPPNVAIVHTGKKSPLEGMKTNGFYGKGVVDNKKIIQVKDGGQNKHNMQEKVKGESDSVAGPSKIGQNVNDPAVSSRRYTFKMIDKTAEVTGKRKETETNGILHGDTRPSKLQRTVQSSQTFSENERNMKMPTTITLSASKPVKVPAQSSPISKEYPTSSVKPMAPIRGQSPLGSTKPPFSSRKSGEVGAQGPQVGPTKPSLSAGMVHGVTVSQEPYSGLTKPPLTEVQVNETTKATPPHLEKNQQTVGCVETAKPPVTPEKFNGIIAAHASPVAPKKLASTSVKEKRKHKSSSKPPSPHPDTKYLSQILSVPNLEELPEFHDTEWLFESKSLSSKERGEGYEKGEEEQVWAKAVRIESADVYALPYVIPY